MKVQIKYVEILNDKKIHSVYVPSKAEKEKRLIINRHGTDLYFNRTYEMKIISSGNTIRESE